MLLAVTAPLSPYCNAVFSYREMLHVRCLNYSFFPRVSPFCSIAQMVLLSSFLSKSTLPTRIYCVIVQYVALTLTDRVNHNTLCVLLPASKRIR